MRERNEAAIASEIDESEATDARGDLASSGCRAIADDVDVRAATLILAGDLHGGVAACARWLGPAIGRFCYLLLGNQAEAEEAAQETFLTALGAAGGFRAEGSLRGWLFTIARRVCAHRLESRTRRARRAVLLTNEHDAHADDASHQVDLLERDGRIRTAVASLSHADREVIALRFDAELPFREIACALSIDEATARKRLERALARHRSCFGRSISEPPTDGDRPLRARRP
jgi:RNA polymerase sigma-70 factor (ECF subfamily)